MENIENLSANVRAHNIKHNIIKCISLELAVLTLISTLNGQISVNSEELPETKETIEPEIPATKKSVRLLDIDKLSVNPIEEVAAFLRSNDLEYTDLLKYAETSSTYRDDFKKLLAKVSGDSNRIILALKGDATFASDTLYIGDSRTQGLLINGTVTEEKTVYGVGYGFDWFTGNGTFSSKKTNALDGAISGIESKMENGKSYNIAIWLGVNDLNYVSAKKYFAKFSELAETEWKNHEIFIVSVSPVHDSRSQYIKNSSIAKFNEDMKNLVAECYLPNVHYVDLGLTQGSISNYDGAGLHYGRQDCVNIQNIVQTSIDTYTLSAEAEIVEFFEEVLIDIDRSIHIDDYIEGVQQNIPIK